MTVANWNAFDWILVVIVGSSMIMAYRRGLVRAIFGLLGFIGGFQLAAWNYAMVSDWVIQARIRMSVQTARVVAFALIVIVVVIVLDVAARLLQTVLRQVGLGWFDRLLGAAFGVARGCMLAFIVLMVTIQLVPQSQEVGSSVLAPYFLAVAHDVSFLVPQYFQQLMVDGAIDLKHDTPRWIKQH